MTNDELLKQLGKTISTIRKSKGMSQLDLCSKIGMEKPNLSAIENGHKNISVSTLKRIADGLKYEVGDLFLFLSEA